MILYGAVFGTFIYTEHINLSKKGLIWQIIIISHAHELFDYWGK